MQMYKEYTEAIHDQSRSKRFSCLTFQHGAQTVYAGPTSLPSSPTIEDVWEEGCGTHEGLGWQACNLSPAVLCDKARGH